MRKKAFGMVLSATMIMAAVTGCGSKGNSENVERTSSLSGIVWNADDMDEGLTDNKTEEKSEAVAENVFVDATENSTEGVTETLAENVTEAESKENQQETFLEMSVSTWSYETAPVHISDKYFMVTISGRYYLIDRDGNMVPDNMLPQGVENGWDDARFYQQDGSFIVTKKTDDGHYTSAILDMELNTIYVASEKDFYFTDYRDGLVFVECQDVAEDGTVNPDRMIRGCGAIIDGKLVFEDTSYYTDKIRIYTVANGLVICSLTTYMDDKESFSYIMPNDIKRLQIEYGDDSGDPRNGMLIPEVDGCPVIFLGTANGDDGWIYSGVLNSERIDDGNGAWHMDIKTVGFYNIFDGSFVEQPEETLSINSVVSDTGLTNATSINNKCKICVGKTDADEPLYKIFDISEGRFLTDEAYISVEISGRKMLLAENTDHKWGYISSDDYKPVGEWYDDASRFCNGLALVTGGGKAHLINERFETVSKEISAESANTMYDHLQFYHINDTAEFYVKRDGSYSLLTVKKK